ncbi:hypothetical protein F4810DRAFT_105810 [Camillea tinctor]|nr:hypothetical protein F4810DRAFT_105810 [Camillea tinctor]
MIPLFLSYIGLIKCISKPPFRRDTGSRSQDYTSSPATLGGGSCPSGYDCGLNVCSATTAASASIALGRTSYYDCLLTAVIAILVSFILYSPMDIMLTCPRSWQLLSCWLDLCS